jgi:hypothetical protein
VSGAVLDGGWRVLFLRDPRTDGPPPVLLAGSDGEGLRQCLAWLHLAGHCDRPTCPHCQESQRQKEPPHAAE